MRRITGIAIAATLAGSAMAADLPISAPPAVPVYNWTGLYFGINGGGAWGHQDPFQIFTDRFDHVAINYSGGEVGGTAGAQIQIAHVVLGFETDLDWAGVRGSSVLTPTIFGSPAGFTVNATTNINWVLTARARVGYAWDNYLFYATGGLALLGAKTSLSTLSGLPCGTFGIIGSGPGELNCSGTNKRIGGTIGGGVEYGFTPNWSAKVEYLYTAAAALEASHFNEMRVGVNYRFGGL
jgi:outer membrane immunogenic protein